MSRVEKNVRQLGEEQLTKLVFGSLEGSAFGTSSYGREEEQFIFENGKWKLGVNDTINFLNNLADMINAQVYDLDITTEEGYKQAVKRLNSN